MLERESARKSNKVQSYTHLKSENQHHVSDIILSVNHRLSVVEGLLNAKIDRSECLSILQSKVNISQVKKITEELNAKHEKDRRYYQEKLAESLRENKRETERLKQRLKGKKKESRRNPEQKNILIKKPQEMYLQSNQTMFSIIVDELASLKQAQDMFEKSLEQRNRVTINLNNQVCEKIQNLQRQMETSLKNIAESSKKIAPDQSRQSWSNSEFNQSKAKQIIKPNFNKTEVKIGTQIHQITHLTRMMEVMQKEIASKINIKDILAIIKKNLQPLNQMIEQVRKYAEEAIQSTKKILINQSQINQQLCLVSKIGWWQSFQEKNGLALWNKEIANLVPQNFICGKDENQIVLVQQGNYIFRVLTFGQDPPQYILISGAEVEIIGQTYMRVEKNTVVQVPSPGCELFLSIQKV